MFIIGICVFIFIVGLTIMTGTTLNNFIDPASLLFVVLSNVAIIISTKGFQEFAYGIKVLVLKNVEIEHQKLSDSIKLFRLLQKSSLGISLLGFLIGTISTLSRLTDPSSIGPSAAIALLVVFYSTLLAVVVFSPAHYMLCKIEQKTEQKTDQKTDQIKQL